MKEPWILHVETATNVCSVSLSKGAELVSIRESDEDKSHGALLTVFMDEVMKEAGINPEDIHAISVSKGPGSYTGLRIGVSAVKGFAYARKIPVIGLVTLQTLSARALHELPASNPDLINEDFLLCPMLDARRMEVYTALYAKDLSTIKDVEALILDENNFAEVLKEKKILFFGNGSGKARELISHPNALFLQNIHASANYMISLALKAFNEGIFEDTAYFEPFYLKDFVATIPRRKVL